MNTDQLHQVISTITAQPRSIALCGLLAAALVCDVRTMRIPNRLCAAGAIVALMFSAMPGAQPGFLHSVAGLGAGLVVLLPLYALRVMGAGDVKLMAAVGAFVGVSQILQLVLVTFIAGGVLALLFAAWHRALPRLALNLRIAMLAPGGQRTAVLLSGSLGRMPYALAIAAGGFTWLALHGPIS